VFGLRDPQPVVRYVNSLRWWFEPALDRPAVWNRVMTRVRSLAMERLSGSELAVRTQTGLWDGPKQVRGTLKPGRTGAQR